jgi:hypothetical protein
MSYRSEARSDAVATVEYFTDDIVDQIIEGEGIYGGREGASDDLLNDYPHGDGYHHEHHTDRFYKLSEAAAILDELTDDEETDSGLWDGLAPREAVIAMAAYTYANAVYSAWRELIRDINEAANDALDDLDETHLERVSDWSNDNCLEFAEKHDVDLAALEDMDETTDEYVELLHQLVGEHGPTDEDKRAAILAAINSTSESFASCS